MSYGSEFWNEMNNEKKKKKQSSTVGKSGTANAKSSYGEEFMSALGDTVEERSKYFQKENKKQKDDDPLALHKALKNRSKEIVSNGRSESEADASSLLDIFKDDVGLFSDGSFEDGVDLEDFAMAPIATVADAGLSVFKGLSNMAEGFTEGIGYIIAGGADLIGADGFAKNMVKDIENFNITEDLTGKASKYLDRYSLLGDMGNALGEGVGQVLGMYGVEQMGSAAGLGAKGTTALTTGTMGTSSFGNSTSEALKSGATTKEAYTYGTIAAVADAGTELMFGGMGKGINALGYSKGLSSADDMLAKTVSKRFESTLAKNFAEFGIKAGAEGFEEVAAGFIQAVGKKVTYMSEEDFGKILNDEKLFEQFVVGALTSGIAQSGYVPGMKQGSLREANKAGRDFITNLTANEQAVVDKVYKDRIEGKELTKRQKDKIYDEVVEDMKKGRIDIDTIEGVLGGEEYKTYKAYTESEDSLRKELEELRNMRSGDMTDIQAERLAKLKGMNLSDNTKRNSMRAELSQKIKGSLQKDYLLHESYNEAMRARQDFAYDESTIAKAKYMDAAKQTYENAIKAGANNTNRVHDMVDMIAKSSGDTGIVYEFKDGEQIKADFIERQTKAIAELEQIENRTVEQNEQLAEMKKVLEQVKSGEVKVNGNITDDGVVINLDSDKPLNRIFGHEVTHSVEKSQAYEQLEQAVFNYAKSKGVDVDALLKAKEAEYAGIKNSNAKRELIADLVGDYLFTDEGFVRNLSAENKNVFMRIYDRIKYFCKIATTGSKEKRDFERLKRAFEDAYKETHGGDLSKVDTKAEMDADEKKYSMSGVNSRTVDNSLLSKAEQMFETGVDSETIRKETGWHKGYDDKWRYEIDDSEFEFHPDGQFTNPDVLRYRELQKKFVNGDITENEFKEIQSLTKVLEGVKITPDTLGDVVSHKKLFEAYPQLKSVKFTYNTLNKGTSGFYSPSNKTITLNNNLIGDNEAIKNTLIHEIQHAIQDIEGFAKGSSVEYWQEQRQDIADTIRGARENLDLWLDDIGYSDFVETSMQEVVNKEKTLAQHWKDLEDFKANSKYAKQIALCEAELAEFQRQYDEITNGMTAYEQYRKTAGEIEARDAENRLNFTAEERKNTRPDIDDPSAIVLGVNGNTNTGDATWLSKNEVEYDAETATLKEQIVHAQETLNKKQVVASANYGKQRFKNKAEAKKWVREELSKWGGQVDRQNFGTIYFSRSDTDYAIEHIDDPYQQTAFGLLPYVLKRGDIIGEHNSHKQRGKHTVTIGAPVEINGTRGNMGVVVNMNGQHAYSARILLPDGSAFVFSDETKKISQGMHQGVLKNESLADTTSEIFDDNIAPLPENVKYSLSASDKTYLNAVNRGDNETAKKMVDEAAENAGYNLRAYHGTPNSDFTVFDKNRVGKGNDQYGAGFYFASNKESASHYGNRVIDVALSIKKPIRITATRDSGINLIDANIELTSKQAYEVVKRHPDMYDPEESPLGDYFDSYWEDGAKDWMVESLAEQYRDVGYLDSDLFRNYPNELHEALRDVVGYDGIEVSFENTGDKFYVAWFDDQMKSTEIVTMDNDGNIIPLSERFNEKNEDIRFSLSNANETYAPEGNFDIYGKDFKKQSAEDIAPVQETVTDDFAPVREDVAETVAEEIPAAEEAVDGKSEAESLVNKDDFLKRRAKELYEEVNNMKKGVRVSRELSHILDRLDLSEENKAESYKSLRTALLNVDARPNQVVNERSVAESVVREMLNSEYDNTVNSLGDDGDVSKSIRNKMRGIKTEIDNLIGLREQSKADYDSEIAEAQNLYDSKKNKNTLEANKILRRIERLKRMQSQNDTKYAERISNLEGRLEKMSQPTYKRAMQRKAKQEQYDREVAELAGDTSAWKDKKWGLQYQTNSLHRNLRDIVRDADGKHNIEKADAIYEYLQGHYNDKEAMLKREDNEIKSPVLDLKLNRTEFKYAHMLGEFRHNPDTTLTKETVEEFYEKNKGKIDSEKVDKAIDETRKILDNLFERVNERLREEGMKEIPYRKGYFPHIKPMKQSLLAKILNWKTVDTEIPTSIAGLTEGFEPVRTYQSFDKQRTSDETDYDLAKALDTYVHGALDWIHHIEDIQRNRAFENYIRYAHSDEGIKARIEEIQNNDTYDADEAQKQIDLVYAEAKNPLNNFVTDLRNRTNNLAGKKSTVNREMEYATNRKAYSTMTNITSRVNANLIAFNIRSAITNFAAIPLSWGQTSPVSTARGLAGVIRNAYRSDGLVEKSTFLTNRFVNEEKLYKTPFWDTAEKAGFAMMELTDHIVSEAIWRAKYTENMNSGMSENEAIRNADMFAENVLAGRSRGNTPTIFNSSNPAWKMLTAFQLEVNNQYGYMFKDMPQDIGKKNVAKLTYGYAKMFVGAYVLNALMTSLTGSGAAFDPIGIIQEFIRDFDADDDDEEDDVQDVANAFANLGKNIAQDIPFVGGLIGGGRIPISSALPDVGNTWDSAVGMIEGGEDFKKHGKDFLDELSKPILNTVLPMGGGQIKKTAQGLGMFSDDHPVAGSYTNSGNLRFPVEDTLGNRIQAGIFGQYANENAREYFDNDYAPLKEKQIQEYIDVEMPIKDYWEYREGLAKQKTLEDKFDYIADLDLPVAKKNILINNIVDRKEEVDMEGYEDFSSLEGFDFATKYPSKYSFSKAVGGYSAYATYSDELRDIHADKDASGKSITGSRKQKVLNYINNLDADFGTKILLFKMEYPSDNTYNKEIVEYLSNHGDLTYDEIVSILTDLDMTVTADGTVYWD